MAEALLGAILCGGRGRRMGGCDKSLLCYHKNLPQREFLRRLLSAVDGIEQVVFSLNPQQAQEAQEFQDAQNAQDAYYKDKAFVVDSIPDEGPMGGIVSVMNAYPNYAVLALACDMPKLTAACLQVLVDSRDARQLATVYRTEEFLQPLTAIYEAPIAEVLRKALRQGQRSLKKILAGLNIKTIQITNTTHATHAPFFTNINSRDAR